MKINFKNREIERIKWYLKEKGLKQSLKREIIASVFFGADKHFSVEGLYDIIKEQEPDISFSTVYRALKLFKKAGLAKASRFMDGVTRYEPVHPEEHHDHLICLGCGRIIEFTNKDIEKLQKGVAKVHGFELISHKLELYGYCDECKNKH